MRVLLCGRSRSFGDRLAEAASCEVLFAASAEEARDRLAETAPARRVDLAVLDASLAGAGGAGGLALAKGLPPGPRRPRLVLLDDATQPVSAGDAARIGLLDVLPDGCPGGEAGPRIAAVLRRIQAADLEERASRRDRRRSRRLARRCSALEARCALVESQRKDISEQVETLCSDLVGAYQELADRLDAVEAPDGGRPEAPPSLATKLGDELGLEPVIRMTLEHLVSAAGATNAAIFLPASLNEFSLSGYVNHTCTAESAGMLLEHLADVVAPRLADAAGPVHLTDNEQLKAWFEDDAAWLDDSEFIGVPCTLEEGEDAECLAVVVLFRDRDQPFGAAALAACEALGPVLAETLHRLIRVHHRSGFAGTDGE